MIALLLSIALAFEPTPAERRAIDALAAHHAPACSRLAEVSATGLARIAEADLKPSWIGMRAARCLMSRTAQAPELVRPWMSDPTRRGLATLTLRHLHHLHEADAVPLARAGLTGPHAAQTRRLLAESPLPALRALSEPTSTP